VRHSRVPRLRFPPAAAVREACCAPAAHPGAHMHTSLHVRSGAGTASSRIRRGVATLQRPGTSAQPWRASPALRMQFRTNGDAGAASFCECGGRWDSEV